MDNSIWKPVGGGTWVGHQPSDQFATYTRGNAGEVYPEVFRPLSFSLSAESGERAMRDAMARSGLLTEAELAAAPLVALGSGVFGGYAYLNLSLARLSAYRLPGAKPSDVDEAWLGTAVESPPPLPSEQVRNIRASLKGLRHMLRTLRTTELPILAEHQLEVDRFLEALPPLDAPDEVFVSLVDRFQDFFFRLYETHLAVSGDAGLAVGALRAMCEQYFDDPELSIELLSGLGDVDSAAPSAAMWKLGRMARDQPAVTEHFESGTADLWVRLQGDPTVSDYVAAMRDFLAEHGFRGPTEWDTAFDTWETAPDLALVLIDRMRVAADDHDPARQAAAVASRRRAAQERIERELGGLRGRLVRRVLTAAQLLSRARERSKTTVVRGIHGVRLRSQELDRRLCARSGGQRGDLWFIVQSELADYVADPAGFASVIEERRALHARLAEREPPFVFTAVQPPLEMWSRRDRPFDQLGAGDRIRGLAGCPGVARGRARIVLDPADGGDLAPGDVLIAPHTDPAWTPLFVPANAVVVDVGAVMSHAVIVSRELGIPCVVSVSEATRRIPDGALVEVDGGAGVVTIVEESEA